jgi:hypothetical protein
MLILFNRFSKDYPKIALLYERREAETIDFLILTILAKNDILQDVDNGPFHNLNWHFLV